MLDLTICDCRPLCHGHRWAIRDERRLALVVAALLLGDHARAEILVHGIRRRIPAPVHDRALEATITELTVDPSRPPSRYNRDGLVFQMISWVAATHAVAGRATLVRAPHVRPADKGMDGFLLEPPDDTRPVWRATVCEDKATEHPRKTVREKVWPEFEEYEERVRDTQINADAGALCGKPAFPSKRSLLLRTTCGGLPIITA
jgi:hypothetical protein